MEHIRSARESGVTASIVFVSSNITDYATSAARLSKDISIDFAQLQVEFAPNMAAAKALLGF